VLSALVLIVFLASAGTLTWSWSTLQSSSAAFADDEVVSGNRLGAGVLDIAVGTDTALFTASNLAAGDSVSGQLVLENQGTLPLAYSLSATAAASALRDALDVVVWVGGSTCGPTPSNGIGTWRPLVDGARASEPRPTDGRLAPGASRLLCMAATLPIGASSAAQGQRLDMLIGVFAVHDLDAQNAGSTVVPPVDERVPEQ
jgi:hypothetical protein